MVRRAGLDDPGRLAALRGSQSLERIGEAPFQRLVELARRLVRSEVALISMVEPDQQTFVGQTGLPEPWATCRRTPLSHSFCQHVVTRGLPLVVYDARKTPLVCENAAIKDLDVVAYLGVPLTTPDGYVLGSLCAIDNEPRHWTYEDVDSLIQLASSVMTEIALRHELQSRKEAERTRDVLFDELNHRIRNLFTLVLGVVRTVSTEDPAVKRFQKDLSARLTTLAQAHSLVFENTVHEDPESGGSDVATVADAILMPLPGSERIHRGGEPVQLSSRQALYAALLFHELGTNALKHGALSIPDGHVKLAWRSEGRELHIDWLERDGPPVEVPVSTGFGSDLIETLSAGSRRADKAILFNQAGLTCRIGIPVS